MSEKTPFIVLTVVFVVGIVGFILMYTTATTGMFNVYGGSVPGFGRAIAAEGAGQANVDEVQAGRKVYGQYQVGAGGISQYEQNQQTGIAVGQAYMTAGGESTGNTVGIVNTGQWSPKRNFRDQYVKLKEGCYVSIPGRQELEGKLGFWRPSWETLPEKTLRKTEECYMVGQEVIVNGETTFARVIPAVMPVTRTDLTMYPWGSDSTACCIPMQGMSTY